MGHEIRRVPLDFDWPVGRTWLAYAVAVKFPECWVCAGSGYSDLGRRLRDMYMNGQLNRPGIGAWDGYALKQAWLADNGHPESAGECPRCEGYGDIATPELREWADNMPHAPIPAGPGWQLWETVGDSPLSPVFETDEQLVDWMTTNPWRMNPQFHGPSLVPSTREVAVAMVEAKWAPSLVSHNDGDGNFTVTDGVGSVGREGGAVMFRDEVRAEAQRSWFGRMVARVCGVR